MPFCFCNTTLCSLTIVLVGMPLIHVVVGYVQHMHQDYYVKRRSQFKQNQKECLLNWYTIGLKLCIITSFIAGAFLQVILYQLYHKRYQVISITECILLLVYSIQMMLILYDAVNYGATTPITKINLLVTLVCYTVFATLLYNQSEQGTDDESIGMSSQDACWILVLVRTILQAIFLIGLSFHSSDQCLITSILAEYEYRQRSSQTSIDDLSVNIHNKQNKVSVFTFNGETNALSNSDFKQNLDSRVTDISVKTYKESQMYDKRTIIYQIDYKFNGVVRTAYRSFREFLSFHNDLHQEHLNELLPNFPNRKEQSLSKQDIIDRREQLDQFMRAILIRFSQHTQMGKFLNLNYDTPQYIPKFAIAPQQERKKRINISSSNRTQSRKTYESIPETIWEGLPGEDEDSLDMQYDRRKQKPSRTLQQPLLQEQQFRYNSPQQHNMLNNEDVSDFPQNDEHVSMQFDTKEQSNSPKYSGYSYEEEKTSQHELGQPCCDQDLP